MRRQLHRRLWQLQRHVHRAGDGVPLRRRTGVPRDRNLRRQLHRRVRQLQRHVLCAGNGVPLRRRTGVPRNRDLRRQLHRRVRQLQRHVLCAGNGVPLRRRTGVPRNRDLRRRGDERLRPLQRFMYCVRQRTAVRDASSVRGRQHRAGISERDGRVRGQGDSGGARNTLRCGIGGVHVGAVGREPRQFRAFEPLLGRGRTSLLLREQRQLQRVCHRRLRGMQRGHADASVHHEQLEQLLQRLPGPPRKPLQLGAMRARRFHERLLRRVQQQQHSRRALLPTVRPSRQHTK